MNNTFEDILARDGLLVYKTRGVSMEPMLRQNRDLVIIKVPASRLKKYDVALYKRGDYYVLHRVIGVGQDCYAIRGDNTYAVEIVPDEAVIGVLSSFQRKGKHISTENRLYRFYARAWNFIYPVRSFTKRLIRLAARVARRVGIRHSSCSGRLKKIRAEAVAINGIRHSSCPQKTQEDKS